jgi:hypothetical protein
MAKQPENQNQQTSGQEQQKTDQQSGSAVQQQTGQQSGQQANQDSTPQSQGSQQIRAILTRVIRQSSSLSSEDERKDLIDRTMIEIKPLIR